MNTSRCTRERETTKKPKFADDSEESRYQNGDMSFTQQDSSAFGGSSTFMKAEKVDKQTRRAWSPQEEAALLVSLKELVANGWKSDNGFRAGYLAKLEEAMGKEFPGTDIKALPHIHSRIQIWKKNYGILTLMLARSGVGFNVHGTHQIDCTNEQWGQIVKCDGIANSMRHKSWPMYEDWKLVFGKDRATGESAEGLIDAVNDLNKDKPPLEEKVADDDSHRIPEYISVDDEQENSTCQSEKVARAHSGAVNTSSGNSKKRKAADPVDKVTDLFLSITSGTHERLDKVVSRIGYEYDVDQAKKEAVKLVEGMSGLTLKQKFVVTEIVVGNKDRLLIFNGLSDSARAEYIQYLLESN